MYDSFRALVYKHSNTRLTCIHQHITLIMILCKSSQPRHKTSILLAFFHKNINKDHKCSNSIIK